MPFAGRLFYPRPPIKLKDRRATAFHEAGHAVIGAYWGIRIGHVSIIPRHSGIDCGRIHWYPRDEGCTAQMYQSSLLAASWAELFANPKTIRLPRVVYTLAGDVPKVRRNRDPFKYDFDARKLVHVFYPEIKRVAQALLIRKRLTGYEVARLAGCPHGSFEERTKQARKKYEKNKSRGRS